MQCNCGGVTKDHDVIKDHVVVAVYARCTSCGRIRWWEYLYDQRVKHMIYPCQSPLRWE